MAWINYRDIQDRFGHIDAEFVRSDVNFSPQGGHASVTVRFYPWWEHPSYVSARDHGKAWGFTEAVQGRRQDVTVRAVAPYAARISQQVEVTDWSFSEEHPLLWDFSEQVTVYINGRLDVLALIERLLEHRMPIVTREDLQRYFDPAWVTVPSRGIAIPAHLYAKTLDCLAKMNVTVLQGSVPMIPKMTVFLLGEDDYIVAEDFMVDLPDFRHDPEWFDPAVRNAAG